MQMLLPFSHMRPHLPKNSAATDSTAMRYALRSIRCVTRRCVHRTRGSLGIRSDLAQWSAKHRQWQNQQGLLQARRPNPEHLTWRTKRSCRAAAVLSSCWRFRNSSVRHTSPRRDGSIMCTPGTKKMGTWLLLSMQSAGSARQPKARIAGCSAAATASFKRRAGVHANQQAGIAVAGHT
jgi:hypothetical protein